MKLLIIMYSKFKLIDSCRENLIKYTIKAFSIIPKMDYPYILDIGCGTGVPTLALMDICDGYFTALDSDKSSLLWLQEKANRMKYNERIEIINASVYDEIKLKNKFDVILAEGLLNVIGFESGLNILLNKIKKGGYIIIHDELKDDAKKRKIFENNKLLLLDSFVLNNDVWWNEYFYPLEKKIEESKEQEIFKKEIKEIDEYRNNPELFQSIYYVLKFNR